VSGSGASRRAAEQAAAKKALDEVMAAAPAVVAKPKRSKGARAAKNAEPEIVPGVTGVQAALDLRSPDRKGERGERGAGRGESRTVAVAESAAERPTLTAASAPLAVIRAAHVEYSGQDKSERAEKADKATEAKPEASAVRSADKHRSRETPTSAAVPTPGVPAPVEHEPGVADAVQTRVADAGH
jgi:ribonuclease-3